MTITLDPMEKHLIEYDLQFFAQEGPGGEKTEEPTAKKKSDVRKDGNVANSNEVNNAASLLIFFILILLTWRHL